ncbi:sulfatase-like hydrolase/transferase [Tunicatimonas pelagia]|uniref:sulfatase-like hydrolase/transferase n=1 Tax=Tunicatimonas pelagia TaxID=931531 RepID=UPI0026650595|nr:sulfatase-like hydrolase/transferase [Tunicatimonas pelagia]WKN44981.1 sulfatase-like hydrolase/transferase [Tunicatimonas pelagia]
MRLSQFLPRHSKIKHPTALVTLLALLLPIVTWAQTTSEATPPNVVLFLADDLGYGDISFEGNQALETPGIDRIAREGLRFTRFYQSAGACAPTRASLLTGRDHLTTGVWGVHWGRDFMHRDEHTLGNLFQRAGYRTGAFGKWHNGKTWAYYSWNRGFDVGVHPRLYDYYDAQVLFNNKIVRVAGPVPNVLGDQATKFIRKNQDRPFFCYLPFLSIHGSHNCPDDLFQKFKAQGFSDHVARVLGMTEQMDKNVQRVLETLDELRLADNTIVIFMVDDGPSGAPDHQLKRRMNAEESAERAALWGYHLKGTKATIWEGGVKSPCYVRWPRKIKAGRQVDTIAGVLDIYPTLADMCDIAFPPDQKTLDGKSLYPLIKGEDTSELLANRTYFDNTNLYLIEEDQFDRSAPRLRDISVQHQAYKLVRKDNYLNGRDTVTYFLHNVIDDPQETENLATAQPELTDSLKRSVNRWYQNITASGRTFQPAVYWVGHWEERSSPINADGVSQVYGDLERTGPGKFYFTNWASPGDGLSYQLHVADSGDYQVELLISPSDSSSQATMKVFTEYDTIVGSVDKKPATSLFNQALTLPSGKQVLTILLEDTLSPSSGLTQLKGIVLHRVAQESDQVLVNAGITLSIGDSLIAKSTLAQETVDFLFRLGRPVYPLVQHENFTITPFADNPEVIHSVKYFIDFELVKVTSSPDHRFRHSFKDKGQYTINAEFSDTKGVKNSSRILVEVI